MFVKLVVWIFVGEIYHVVITGDFGDNRGGGDCAKFIIGFNAGRYVGFKGGVFEEIDFAIDDDLGERDVKLLN